MTAEPSPPAGPDPVLPAPAIPLESSLPLAPWKGLAALRAVCPIAAALTALVAAAALILLLRWVIYTEAGYSRFDAMFKTLVWIALMLAPAVGYHLIGKRLHNEPALAGAMPALSMVHALASIAAAGMWWNDYAILTRAAIIAWGCCGLLVFVPAVVAEVNKPRADDEAVDPTAQQSRRQPD